MSIKEWEWMNRPELTNQKGWVIVRGENVYNYETWNEAVIVNQMLGGHLMSKEYHENHYKNESNTKTI
jgi:hypothetical protein